jgi:DNA repair protein RadC
MYTFTDDNAVVERAKHILRARVTEQVKQDGFNLPRTRAELGSIKDYLAVSMGGYDVEHFDALYFRADGAMLAHVNIGIGDEKEVEAKPREVLRQGLLVNATYCIIAHNHPNGDATPSKQDSKYALMIAQKLDDVGIELLGAYVVGADEVAEVKPPEPEPDNPFERVMLDIARRAQEQREKGH